MTKPPVCVLGLGLIGGSVMRAAAGAGRGVFGYNRSIESVTAARADGFDADENIEKVLQRAAETGALIVVAVPVPALPIVFEHIRELAPDNPLTDVTSVKAAVLDQVTSFGLLDTFVGGHPMAGTAHSGWAATDAKLFDGAAWVLSVDDHVDPDVWAVAMHLALDCGAIVVPAKSDEHDAAAAAISHLPHLLAESLATTAGDVPLATTLAAGSFRDGTRVAGTAPDLVRAMCEANAVPLLAALDRCVDMLADARRSLAAEGSVADLAENGHAAKSRFDAFHPSQIVAVVVGQDGWRDELAAAGRAGGVIKSALPVLGSRG